MDKFFLKCRGEQENEIVQNMSSLHFKSEGILDVR